MTHFLASDAKNIACGMPCKYGPTVQFMKDHAIMCKSSCTRRLSVVVYKVSLHVTVGHVAKIKYIAMCLY